MLYTALFAMLVAWPWLFNGRVGLAAINRLPEVDSDLSTLDRKDGLS